MEYRWAELSLLLGAGAVSTSFQNSLSTLRHDRANTILVFMPRVEDEDKENKDDGQPNRRNERTKEIVDLFINYIAIIPAVFSISAKYIFFFMKTHETAANTKDLAKNFIPVSEFYLENV